MPILVFEDVTYFLLIGAPLNINHFPDVRSRDGLYDILQLASFVMLYGAVHPEAYEGIEQVDDDLGSPLPMAIDRYADYEYALWCIMQLGEYFDAHFEIAVPDPDTGKASVDCQAPELTFMEILEVCDTTILFASGA